MKSNLNFGERLKSIFFKVFLILSLFCTSNVFAQIPPGDCPCDPDDADYDICAAQYPDCDAVATIPINADVKWLLYGGVALAFYVLHKRPQNQKMVKNPCAN